MHCIVLPCKRHFAGGAIDSIIIRIENRLVGDRVLLIGQVRMIVIFAVLAVEQSGDIDGKARI